MKQLFCGLVALGVFFGAVGQARSDFIYWCENGSGSIQRANLDGSGKTTLVSGQSSPVGTALDLAGGTMYWAENSRGTIRRANLDGSGPTTLVTGLSSPTTVALDPAANQMYWTYGLFGIGGYQRANLDGSGLTTLISGVNAAMPVASASDGPT